MTEQTVALSPPQEGLPSILEAAPGFAQKVPTRRLSPINSLSAIIRDTLPLTQKMYSPPYESTSNQHKQQRTYSHLLTNNRSNSRTFTSSAPTNALVEPPMMTFTQADINQRIVAALDTYRLQHRKAEDLRHFLQCILFYFVATNNTRLSDEAKIAFTVALMRKDLGKTWADTYYEKSAGGVQVYPNWAAFATALEEAFSEHRTKTALSLGNYVTRFEQLVSKAQLKDAEVNGVNRTENDYHTLHANFVKGLLKELYVSLATRVARDRPNTVKAWGPSLSQTPGTMASQWISTPLQSRQLLPSHREEGSGN
ncbi:hypothetical protein IEO21_08783 [Rhodonia placenta]|uniref:Retrotransposon gag domain-containing protein n=1 Tax=Rhodonia placenta TaxID=104341 RepID=A0A8H7NVJ4_9APHY|nr:hypothetical protein IEO21_08783 [Postia placenta]